MNAPVKLGLALLLAGTAAAPAWAQQTAAERRDLERYQKYAEPPVDHVRFFQLTGFQYLAPDTVAVRFGVNRMYLLTVQTPCINLAYANAIGLTSRNHTVYSKLDAVTLGGPARGTQRCQILKIVPVNERKMKQDAAKAGTAAPASSG